MKGNRVWALTSFLSACAAAISIILLIGAEVKVTGSSALAANNPNGTGIHTVCKAGPPACDYRVIQEAVDAAQDGDIIEVAAGIYTDVHERPSPPGYLGPDTVFQAVYISKSLTIIGGLAEDFWAAEEQPAGQTVIDLQRQGRGLFISGDITVTLKNLHIQNNTANDQGGLPPDNPTVDFQDAGGGIYMSLAALTISNSKIMTNRLSTGAGGGICNYPDGSLSIFGSRISNNRGMVGGIYSQGELNLINSDVYKNNDIENFGEFTGIGGVLSVGSLSMVNSRVNENFGYSGGLRQSGIGKIVDSEISHNRGLRLAGLGTSGYLVLENSAIVGNGPGEYGGGGISNDGTLIIGNSTVSGNFTYDWWDDGAGIKNSGILIVTNSTISSNSTFYEGFGGGILNRGEAIITNTTISQNSAGYGGGGIYNEEDGVITLHNVTLTNNRASDNRPEGGPGGIYLTGGTITVSNSIIARNIDDSGRSFPDCYREAGTLISLGHNLVGVSEGCEVIFAPGDLTGTLKAPLDPRLGPLQDNGGGTGTHALYSTSPAIDAGSPVPPGSGSGACAPADQRNVSRPIDGNLDGEPMCDIGAYELLPAAIITLSLEGPLTGSIGVSQTFTATVSPISATLPIYYEWQITDNTVISKETGLVDAVSWSWDRAGTKVFTVTASNIASSATATHSIEITDPNKYIYIPIVRREVGLNESDFIESRWIIGLASAVIIATGPILLLTRNMAGKAGF